MEQQKSRFVDRLGWIFTSWPMAFIVPGMCFFYGKILTDSAQTAIALAVGALFGWLLLKATNITGWWKMLFALIWMGVLIHGGSLWWNKYHSNSQPPPLEIGELFEVESKDHTNQSFKDLKASAKIISLRASGHSSNYFEGSEFNGSEGSVGMNRIAQSGDVYTKDASITLSPGSSLTFEADRPKED